MTPTLLPRGLAAKRAMARLVLWFERLWPAFWPPLGVLGLYAAAALLDLPALLPPWPRLLLPLLVLALAAVLLGLGLRRVRRPDAAGIDRRLERASGLRHQPLAGLQDRPADDSPLSWAIWHRHQARLAAQVRRLRVGWPHPGLPGQDRRALRLLVLLLILAGVAVAGREAPGRLWRAALPGLPTVPGAPGTQVQAWITPPPYTGLAPQFLTAAVSEVRVPVGSALTVSVTGGQDAPVLSLPDGTVPFRALDAHSWQAEHPIGQPGHLSVTRTFGEVAGWTLVVIPDNPPMAAWADPPGPVQGLGPAALQTRLAWRAEDDYGVVGVQAELRLADRPEAPPLTVSVTPSGSPKAAHGTSVQDLTAHPWAGLAVTARVVARDALGQTGASEDARFVLPERRFSHPMAQAVIAIRKQLSLTPDARRDAARALTALGDRPDLFDDSLTIATELYGAAALLRRGRGEDAVTEAQSRLWQLALALEEGAPDRTAKALEQARQAMRDAMDAAKQDPANAEKQAELQQRMEALRQAIQKHIDALMEQARREGTEMPFDPNQPQMDARDLDRMAQEMERAAREGRMDDAQRQMAELEKLLEQLQNARPEAGEQRQQRNAERRQRGRQQQDAVQDLVRREGQLLDRSRTRSDAAQPPPGPTLTPQQQMLEQLRRQLDPQRQFALPSPAPQPPPDSQANQAQPSPERAQDQRAQQAMRRALGELMQRFGDLTGQVPAPLSEADIAMRDAAQATAQGQDAAAGAAQQRAIEALQKGNRQMGQQLARQFGRGEPQEGEGEDGQDGQDGNDPGQAGNDPSGMGNDDGRTAGPRPGEQQGQGHRRTARRDPLGRPLNEGTSGSDETDRVRVPEEMEMARTRALQEELRRRGAERTRPQDELNYIDRLLQTP